MECLYCVRCDALRCCDALQRIWMVWMDGHAGAIDTIVVKNWRMANLLRSTRMTAELLGSAQCRMCRAQCVTPRPLPAATAVADCGVEEEGGGPRKESGSGDGVATASVVGVGIGAMLLGLAVGAGFAARWPGRR